MSEEKELAIYAAIKASKNKAKFYERTLEPSEAQKRKTDMIPEILAILAGRLDEAAKAVRIMSDKRKAAQALLQAPEFSEKH